MASVVLGGHTSLVTLTVSLRATLNALSTLFTNQCSAFRATCTIVDLITLLITLL